MMRAVGSSLGSWRSIERQERTKGVHGLCFSLAVVAEIGREHGLAMRAEESLDEPREACGYDAVFISVLDSRCMVETARSFREWGIPLRRRQRGPDYPVIWAGGQGLHNPMPYAEVADLIVVGDAEGPLPELLAAWHRHGPGSGFLAAAATIQGVYVPAYHDPSEAVIVQSVAKRFPASVKTPIRINLDTTRRIEIARGCRYSCAFCGLGWRAPYRELDTDVLLDALRADGGKHVHLQAGDAESHSGISSLRACIAELGGRDQGWTGRLDSVDLDVGVPATKRFAFGVEGVSHRLRRAVGKGALTDDFLTDSTVAVLDAVQGEGQGRTAWHIIAGLPTQRLAEARDLAAVVRRIGMARLTGVRRNLAIHIQPFQPLPGTPLQWCSVGRGARILARMIGDVPPHSSLHVWTQAGRSDRMAAICTILSRAGPSAVALLDALGSGDVSPRDACALAETSFGALDLDEPLPWGWISYSTAESILRKAHGVAMRRLAEQ